MELWEKTVESEVKYEGVIVRVRMDRAELPNGRLAPREVVEHPGGVAVLPLTDEGKVLCVRQFRYPFGQVLLEVPAGKLEWQEEHRGAALRELKEEVGAVPERLDYLGKIYPSPGYSAEVLHLYLARGLTRGEACPDEDEFLNIEELPLEELVAQVMAGELPDAKTVAAVMMTQQLLREEQA